MNVASRVANGEDMIDEKVGEGEPCPFGYSCAGILLSVVVVKTALFISEVGQEDARGVLSENSERAEAEMSNRWMRLMMTLYRLNLLTPVCGVVVVCIWRLD
jgi:hypothetical protein